MAEFPAKLCTLLNEFKSLEGQDLRSELLIEFAERFKEVPATVATRPFAKEHLVPGCESEAFLWCSRLADGFIKLYFAVENPQGISAKALASILDETLSGESPENIALVSEEMVLDIFGKNLSMGKGQGLMSMVRMAKAVAKQRTRVNANF